MQDCYAADATFSDPVFTGLNAAQVKSMWEMLCKKGKDLVVEFHGLTATGNTATISWIAHYSFSATGRKVVNRVHARFLIENGKIVQHTDHFDFYRWARQALGITGLLLGWTPFLKKKIRKSALQNLQDFMDKTTHPS